MAFEWLMNGTINDVRGGSFSSPSSGGVLSGVGKMWNDLSGTTANNDFNAIEAEKARVFNSAEAQKQRDFEEYMSNTAYQRGAADMKSAGINPASLGGNGAASAASTPAGSSAQGVAASATTNNSRGFVGVVMDALGLALRAKILHSAMANQKEGLSLKRFAAETNKALDAAKIANLEASTALKQDQLAKAAGKQSSAEIMKKALANEAKRLAGDEQAYLKRAKERFG